MNSLKGIAFLLGIMLLFSEGSALPVFPGAEGFGVNTVAGRGGQVLKVTRLEDDLNPGSLRWAVSQPYQRVIVFEVSGVIELKSRLFVEEPFVTIAGQTAPSPGITLKGSVLDVKTHDVLVQHLHVRVGNETSDSDPGTLRGISATPLWGTQAAPYNVVFDHVSVSWTTDKIVLVWPPAHDITFSNSIFSECLYDSIDPESAHSMGPLIGPKTKNIAFIKNLMAHCYTRVPKISGETTTLIVNNVIYNPIWHFMDIVNINDIGQPKSTVIGNVAIKGPDSKNSKLITKVLEIDRVRPGTQVYVEDNECIDRTSDPWSCVSIGLDLEGNQIRKEDVKASAPPVWVEPLTVKPSSQAKEWVLTHAGARPKDRDPVDARIANEVRNRSGRIVDCILPEPFYYPVGSVGANNSESTVHLPDAPGWKNRYVGKQIEITSGKGAGQVREITAWDGWKQSEPNVAPTKIATVTPNWNVIPDSTSRYRIINDCTKNAGGWPAVAENYRSLIVPENPNADDDGDGYTNLEEWLHSFSCEVELECPSSCGDSDGDGFADAVCGGSDCNDSNPAVNPNAAETCNGLDDNCDGLIDEDLSRQCGPSTDSGNCEFGVQACTNSAWGSCEGAVYPTEEVCGNQVDEDCDGSDLECEECTEKETTRPCITSTGCNGTQECINSLWRSCKKDDLCCGVNCNDFDGCTNDYCVEGLCVFAETGECIKLKEFSVERDGAIKEGEEFTVTVKDKTTGKAVKQAKVSYGEEIKYSDEKGMALFTARKEFIKVRVEKEGYLSKEVALPLASMVIPEPCGNNQCEENETPQNCPIDCIKREAGKLIISSSGDVVVGLEFTVTVMDEKGNAVKGATVTYGKQTKTTGENGAAVFVGEETQKTIKAQKGEFSGTKKVNPMKTPIEAKELQKEIVIAGLLLFSLAILLMVYFVFFKIRK